MLNLFFRKLSIKDKKEISSAIHEAESQTSGEIRVHVSYAKKETNPLQAAQMHFQKMKMHETRSRNAILLYINPRLKKFAFFGDEGIHQKVGQTFWDQLRTNVRQIIRDESVRHGIVHAVGAIGIALKEHFPHIDQEDDNQLSDEVTESN